MSTHLSIVTGGSRGLGHALVEQLLARGHHVLSLARRPTELPVPAGGRLEAWTVDLADPLPVAERLARWLAAQNPAALASVTLVHNAGVVSTPAPLSASDPAALSSALRVGLEAPLVLSASFLHATESWALPRKLLFISSGLGRRAMAGSGSYCAAKAGMDHLARALALEEAAKPHGARVVSLAPGVIDTDMQVQLRGADPALFPERVRFQSLKDNGQLDSPAQAAAKVLKVLDRDDFGSLPVTDVRELA
jgi:NAD(P)-dependent dehydrogenase (short-subunit alcohol dehydrogenase family)